MRSGGRHVHAGLEPRETAELHRGRSGALAPLPGAHRCRRAHRAHRLDAGRLSADADPADLPARPFRDHRHAAGRQLADADAEPQAQASAHGQDPGRSRSRPLSLRRCGDARRVTRGACGPAPQRQGQVLLDLQLPDAELGRYRRHRLAGGRRGDHEPDPDLPLQLRPLCSRHDSHLQGGELSPAPGLRDHDVARARHA